MAHLTVSAAARLARVVCLSSDAPGDCVYVSGPAVSGTMQVAKADITTIAKMPAIGVLLSKDTATTGVAILEGFYDVALPPGATRVWVGASGALVATPPTAPAFIESMGIAVDGGRALVRPSMNMCKVNVS